MLCSTSEKIGLSAASSATGELDAVGVPFQVAGGLAARAHGASCPLHDIDLYVPEGALERLRARFADHVRRM